MDPLLCNLLGVLVFWDARTQWFVGGVLTLLGAASTVVVALRRRVDSGLDPAIIETFRMRVRAWWVLCTVLAAAFLNETIGPRTIWGSVAAFAGVLVGRSRAAA
jgi:predicted CDP-diglyceride synthetase/phosphatidate cytidylyltransferase